MNKKILYWVLGILFILLVLGLVGYNIKLAANNVVNLVFSTDINYKEYAKVAIKSAIVNKDEKSIYNINILCVDLTKSQMDEFKKFETKNVKIRPMALKLDSISYIGDYDMPHRVTRTDLFKFVMPELFPELDKVLYIDSDTVILKDLRKLYNTNLLGFPLAAVKKFDAPEYKELTIWGYSWRYYKRYDYNCGVLLFNLKKWRKDNLTEKLVISKNNDRYRDFVTQRTFNEVIPLWRVKPLSPIYNVYSRMKDISFEVRDYKKIYFPYCMKINSAQDLYDAAVIVHLSRR